MAADLKALVRAHADTTESVYVIFTLRYIRILWLTFYAFDSGKVLRSFEIFLFVLCLKNTRSLLCKCRKGSFLKDKFESQTILSKFHGNDVLNNV